MEQIRQLLAQLSLHLELNIAMCDMIEQMDKRLSKLEPSHEALRKRVDSLGTQVSQYAYHLADQRFNARQEAKKGGN